MNVLDWAAGITQSLFSLSRNEGLAHQHSHFEHHLASTVGTAVWELPGQLALAAGDAAAPISHVSLGGCSTGDRKDMSLSAGDPALLGWGSYCDGV